MANALIPVEEQNLTPDQIDALDKRRHKGQMFLIIGWQMLIFAALLSLWAAQDLIYSPVHPIAGLMLLTLVIAVVMLISGYSLRRGTPEFF